MTIAPETASSPQPMCALHPARKAVTTCERCGRYVCSGCVRNGGRCPECVRQGVAAVPSSEVRARRARLFIGLAGGVGAAGLPLSVWPLLVPGESGTRDVVEGIYGLGGSVILIAAPIIYLMWLHRVVRQLNALGVDVGVTPGWAVGYWFVPFINLVRPYRIVRRIVEELGGEPLAASLQLGAWWGTLLLARFLGRIEARLELQNGLEGPVPEAAYYFGMGSSVFTIAAAILCVRIIREVQDRLEARRSDL